MASPPSSCATAAAPALCSALTLVLAACQQTEPLGPDRHISACEVVTLPPSRPGAADTFSVEGLPLLLEPTDEGGRRFTAPARNRPTPFIITRRTGDLEERVVIEVDPATTPEGLTPGLMPACGPFQQGVASGDPQGAAVLLWTRVDVSAGPRRLRWQIAEDPDFATVLAEDEVLANAQHDGSVTVEPTGLPAATTLWYRFVDEEGTSSELGRTRTAPEGVSDRLVFGVTSCSSLWSGWFNTYDRIAHRSDLDLVIHLGDLVYDFVDENEHLRLPAVFPDDPTTPEDWRTRFLDYLLDPDQRAARAAAPWAVLWDNHDSDTSGDEAAEGTRALYRDYVPMRRPDPSGSGRAYRHLPYGDLVDLYLLDVTSHEEPGSLLGLAQEAWIEAHLQESSARWRVIGTQKLVTSMVVPGANLVGDPTPWDDFPAGRVRLLDALGAHQGNLVLSGDLHFSVAADLVADPSTYDPQTGVGSVGVELLPTSTTRGNFDESVCGGTCDEGELAVIENIRQSILSHNPHHRFVDLIEHGWGLVEIDPDAVSVELRYVPIHAPLDDERVGATLRAEHAVGRWSR